MGEIAGATTVRGRQAEAAVNDRRLLAAARDVFAAQGYDAPVSAVAAAAGIGMGSLYRRYPTKDALLADLCLRSMREMTAAAATAQGASTDPWARLLAFIRACVSARCGAFAPVAGRIPVSPEMIAEAGRSQRAATALVAAAQKSGALRPDVTVVDVLRLIELFSRSASDRQIDWRLLGIALAGLRTDSGPAAEPLPGPAPTISAYRGRWAPRPNSRAQPAQPASR